MARAVQVFKTHGLEMRRLEGAAAARRPATEEERRRSELAREQAAAEFGAVVDALAQGLGRLSDGDLRLRVDQAFADHNERLRTDFNAAMSKLERGVAAVVDNTRSIGAGAGQISQARTTSPGARNSRPRTWRKPQRLWRRSPPPSAAPPKHAKSAPAARRDAEQSGEVVRRAVGAMGGH